MPMTWGLIVIVLGLAAGFLLVRRGRADSATTASTDGPDVTDPTHRRAELERERNRLTRKLRSSDLTDADRADLELAAARVLRELDTLGSASAASPSDVEKAQGALPARPHRSAWAGFAWGVGITAGIVALALLAGRSSSARREGQPITGGDSVAPAPTAGFEHPSGEVSEEIEKQLQDLEARWTERQDIVALKELTLANLSLERFMEAFRWSNEILQREPADPDGHYAQGIVRMAMGQSEAAIGHFDRVLANFPNHALALVAKGAVLRGEGRLQEAKGAWEQALIVVGGRDPQIEQLIADLERSGSQTSAVESNGTTEPRVNVANGYTLDLRCARPRPADHLFISLRDGSGPPAAARRIDRPDFPQRVVLTDRDSMMGGSLPERATVSVRWDADGNAMTREVLPEVTAQVTAGSQITLEVCS